MTKKEAIQAYKEQKIPRGVFAVRCEEAGKVWVGASPNLNAAENALRFALRHGSHLNKPLQAEWNARGAAAFRFEILQKLDDDLLPMAVADALKDARRSWAEQLGAATLL